MYVENDYILRLIHEIIRLLIRLLTGKDIDQSEELRLSPENEEFYRRLLTMTDDGDINAAENELIAGIRLDDTQYLQLSLLYFEYLNGKSDSFLTEHNFSREEIWDDIKSITNIYGYGSIAEAFMRDLL